MKDPVLLAKIFRGDYVESIHLGHAVLYGENKIIESWGDPGFKCFTRSIIKIIQAKVSSELLEEELSSDELAIIASSHRAENQHLSVISKLIEKFDLDSSKLQCGYHPHKKDSQLNHYCSAKHLAMLAACEKQGWGMDNYIEKDHPLQIKIIEEVKKLNSECSIITEKDGCGLPSFYMSLTDMAKLFSSLIKDSAYQKFIEAANQHPELIASKANFDTDLMMQYPGKFYAKGGAEGMILIINLELKQVLLVKVLDGSDRAKKQIASKFIKELLA